jgi:hypothetical protein
MLFIISGVDKAHVLEPNVWLQISVLEKV